MKLLSKSKPIVLGLSGGVDSAVAALLLKRAGRNVIGTFMRNWDEQEELGNENCSVERDLRDASAIAKKLSIPFSEVDFVSKYWGRVFQTFLDDYARGLTPNPDLACNRHIKFGALLEYAKEVHGADTVATGHYARLREFREGVQLLRGIDELKDQTYFLASSHIESLSHAMFPVGHLLKSEVKALALEAGLDWLVQKKSSAGICFIGKRNFGQFIEQYIPSRPGHYIDVETGKSMGYCQNVLSITYGQRPGIGGAGNRTYVVGKDCEKNLVYVAEGRNHPALFTKTALLKNPHWLLTETSQIHRMLGEEEGMRCQYKARYGQEVKWCTVRLWDGRDGFDASMYSKDHRLGEEGVWQNGTLLTAEFDEPAMAVTPQQAFVMYDNDVCLGSADIVLPGRTLFEHGM